MFEIIGFIVLFIIMAKLSVAGFLCCVNNLGQYNIGGVPNSKTTKFWTIVFLIVIAVLWYQLFKHAPFHISFD